MRKLLPIILFALFGLFPQNPPGGYNQTSASSNTVVFGTGGGTGTAQTVTPTTAIASYTNGLTVSWLPSANATGGATTLSVSGLATKSLVVCPTRAGSNLQALDFSTTTLATAIYDGTAFELLNPITTICGVKAPNTTTFVNGLSISNTGALTLVSIADINTAPTISSGFAASGTTISASNGTAAFTITIGTTPGSTGVIGLPSATHGWAVHCDDITTQSTSVSQTQQTAVSTNSATLTQYSDVHVATAWVAGDVLVCQARGY